jgi:predicted alpha/beta hydrolase
MIDSLDSPNLGLLHAALGLTTDESVAGRADLPSATPWEWGERSRRSLAVPDAAVRRLRFPATDGRVLEGRLFQPEERAIGAILIGGATGVPQGFYAAYARWLSRQGWAVLTFDYRGIGLSREGPLALDPARMRDWGRLDLPAALDTLAHWVPERPLHLIGHSVGGQMLGLMPNHHRLSRAVMLASGFGYWGNMAPMYGTMVRALISGIAPALYRLLGYAPNRAMGWGENLPRGVAEDWFRWCRRPDYYAELLAEQGRSRFDDVRLPVLAMSFSDDPIATEANVAAQLALYSAADVTRLRLRPADFERSRIGHLHFFSSKMPETLWRLPLDWLSSP